MTSESRRFFTYRCRVKVARSVRRGPVDCRLNGEIGNHIGGLSVVVREQFVGDDSFKYFRNDRCERNCAIEIWVISFTAFMNKKIAACSQEVRKIESLRETQETMKKRSQLKSTF